MDVDEGSLARTGAGMQPPCLHHLVARVLAGVASAVVRAEGHVLAVPRQGLEDAPAMTGRIEPWSTGRVEPARRSAFAGREDDMRRLEELLFVSMERADDDFFLVLIECDDAMMLANIDPFLTCDSHPLHEQLFFRRLAQPEISDHRQLHRLIEDQLISWKALDARGHRRLLEHDVRKTSIDRTQRLRRAFAFVQPTLRAA